MQRSLIVSLVLSAAGCLPAVSRAAVAPAPGCIASANAAFMAWRSGQAQRMQAYLAPTVKAEMTPAKWRAAWAQTEREFGRFASIGNFAPHQYAGQSFLAAKATFGTNALAIVVQCDGEQHITTFRAVPAAAIPGLVKTALTPLPSGAVSRNVEVSTPLGPLPGKLVLPKGPGPFPAVVLVQGSGNLDYDETVGPNKPFRDIAMGLAAAGVASLRYDKRSYVYGKAMQGKAWTVDDSVTDDALVAAHLLARQPGVDPQRVFVLGHSLGAAMAPRIAGRDPQLAGIVLLAAPARPLLDVLAWQLRELGSLAGESAGVIAKQEQGVAAERKLLAAADPAHPPKGTYFHAPQSFWLSLRDYHQVAVAAKLALPILIVQGDADLNVSPKLDFARWQQALAGHANVTFRAYPGLSHLFMPAQRTAVAVDMTPGHVSPQVIRDVAGWIKAQPTAR